jgi:surface antigen
MKYIYFLLFFLSACNSTNEFKSHQVGDKIDSLNGVYVFENGSMGNVSSRNVTEDGYNLGLRYQCVEFVKRYYYEHYNHKMPDSYGDAKDFFDRSLADGDLNPQRDLTQYKNGGKSCPKVGDLLVYDGSVFNKFGHVAIVSNVTADDIEVIQQNCGSSRETYDLENNNNTFTIANDRILGWLRKD